MTNYTINNPGGTFKGQILPEIEVFQHINFNFQTTTKPLNPGEPEVDLVNGNERLRTTFDVDLKGHPLDQNITSIIIYSGTWQFFNSVGTLIATLEPGQYATVVDFGMENDKISSFKCVTSVPAPNPTPEPEPNPTPGPTQIRLEALGVLVSVEPLH